MRTLFSSLLIILLAFLSKTWAYGTINTYRTVDFLNPLRNDTFICLLPFLEFKLADWKGKGIWDNKIKSFDIYASNINYTSESALQYGYLSPSSIFYNGNSLNGSLAFRWRYDLAFITTYGYGEAVIQTLNWNITDNIGTFSNGSTSHNTTFTAQWKLIQSISLFGLSSLLPAVKTDIENVLNSNIVPILAKAVKAGIEKTIPEWYLTVEANPMNSITLPGVSGAYVNNSAVAIQIMDNQLGYQVSIDGSVQANSGKIKSSRTAQQVSFTKNATGANFYQQIMDEFLENAANVTMLITQPKWSYTNSTFPKGLGFSLQVSDWTSVISKLSKSYNNTDLLELNCITNTTTQVNVTSGNVNTNWVFPVTCNLIGAKDKKQVATMMLGVGVSSTPVIKSSNLSFTSGNFTLSNYSYQCYLTGCSVQDKQLSKMVGTFLTYYQTTVSDFFGVNQNFKYLYNSAVAVGAGYVLVSGVYDMSYKGVGLNQDSTELYPGLFMS